MSDIASPTEILELVEEHEYKCALTGLPLTTENSTVDHIIPVALGGSNQKENLQPVLKEANRIKGQLSMEDLKKWVVLIYDHINKG
jgi:5-methylcytosine-specific restriction endonuclease McrA